MRTDKRPKVAIAYERSSQGIAWYAEGLAKAVASGADVVPISKADVVHVHFGNSSRLIHLLARRLPPCVLTIHDVLPRSPALRRVLGTRLARIWAERSQVVLVHNSEAWSLLGHGPARVMPMWTEVRDPGPDAREEFGIPRDALVVGVFGRWVPHKGTTFIEETISRLSAPAHVLIAGKGVRSPTLGASVDVTVLDSPDDARYGLALDAADVLLSFRQGSVGETSAPVLQAIGRGIPVLHHGLASTTEAVADAGRSVSSPAEAAALIASLARDRDELAVLKAKARRRRSEFALGTIAERHAEIYKEVAFP